MGKDHATTFGGASQFTFAVALNSTSVLVQASSNPNVYEIYQSTYAQMGASLVWDIPSNKFFPFDKIPGTWLAMRPVVMFRKSQNDLFTVTGDLFDPNQHVHRIDFSTPCLGCDSTNGDCVLGIYCQCNNPNSPAGNCSRSCDDCIHGECFPGSRNPPGICVCERGWTGEKCDQRLECERGYLSPANQSDPLGPQECQCSSPWLGDKCDHSTSDLIQYFFGHLFLFFCFFAWIF
jgi:hypothetical protein